MSKHWREYFSFFFTVNGTYHYYIHLSASFVGQPVPLGTSSICKRESLRLVEQGFCWPKCFLPPNHRCLSTVKKVKAAHTKLLRVGFWSWSRFLTVSLQVTRVINPAAGYHYSPPSLQLPSQPLRGLLPFRCLLNRGTMGVNSLPKTVTRQHCGCNLNPGPSAAG